MTWLIVLAAVAVAVAVDISHDVWRQARDRRRRMHAINRLSSDVSVLAMLKGRDRYIWLFTDVNRSEVFRSLGRFASNPDLNLTWYDAARLSQRVRELTGDKT